MGSNALFQITSMRKLLGTFMQGFYYCLLTITIKGFPPIWILKSFKQLKRLGKNNGRGWAGEGGHVKKRGLLNIKAIVNTKKFNSRLCL